MPDFSIRPPADFQGGGALNPFLEEISPKTTIEQFHQSFTGPDFKITAVIPYDSDVNSDKTAERAGLEQSAGKLQRIIDAPLGASPLPPAQQIAQQQQAALDLAEINRQMVRLSEKADGPFYKTFAELQTLSITTRRSVNPVRRLGEATPTYYTRGPRTIAGSMVFIFLQEDVLLDIFRKTRDDMFDGEPSFIMDRLPPFNIIITGTNEFGHQIEGGLFGVTLLASGTTLSIDDLFTEQQYTYVARWMLPLAKQTRTRERLKKVGLSLLPFGLGAISGLHTPININQVGTGKRPRNYF
jgi:hypothetical protein